MENNISRYIPSEFVSFPLGNGNGASAMENSHLNQAHFQARKAEKLAHQRKFSSAIECHQKALSLLSDAMVITDIRVIQQSLQCQKEYHKKQITLLQSKLEYLDRFKKEMMSDIKQTEDALTQSQESQAPLAEKDKVAQMEILRTLSEADLALQLHADCCSSMDPNLNQVAECLRKMRQQLEQLFHLSRISDNSDLQLEAIKPADEGRYSPSFTSVGDNLHETEADLPTLAPLEVPRFDFPILSDDKLED